MSGIINVSTSIYVSIVDEAEDHRCGITSYSSKHTCGTRSTCGRLRTTGPPSRCAGSGVGHATPGCVVRP